MNQYELTAQLVHQATEYAKGYSIAIKRFSSSPWSGQAHRPSKKYQDAWIRVPEPTTAIRLHTYLHELGHFKYEKVKPGCLQEYYADRFAYDVFKEYNVKVSRKDMRKLQIRTARYITYKLCQALNRGMQKIPKELLSFRKYYSEHAKGGRWYVDETHIEREFK